MKEKNSPAIILEGTTAMRDKDCESVAPDSVTNKFFRLLRYAVGTSDEAPVISAEEWSTVRTIASRQALTGVIFGGVERMPAKLRPCREILLRWIGECGMIEKRNAAVDRACADVSAWFGRRGYRSCVLKGQGNALMYSCPARRTPGDIDLWIEGSPDDIMRMVQSMFPSSALYYHHAELPEFEGVPVELHYRPSFAHSFVRNRRLQRWYSLRVSEQFANTVELGGGRVAVPTEEFGVVMQLSHMYHHLFSEGVGLRQLTDFFYLLRHGGTCRRSDLQSMGLYPFACAVAWIMRNVYGMSDSPLPAEPDVRRGVFVLNEVLAGGNFGQYDERYRFSKGFVGHNMQRLWRDVRLLRYFPEESLCEPVFRLWHFFWRLCHGGHLRGE